MSMDQIYQDYVSDHGISFGTFSEVYERFAWAYDIDKHLARPGDAITLYSDLDEWSLGEGAEKMGRWLSGEFDHDPETDKPTTVMDVMQLVQARSDKT
jgi:hypothetical protein